MVVRVRRVGSCLHCGFGVPMAGRRPRRNRVKRLDVMDELNVSGHVLASAGYIMFGVALFLRGVGEAFPYPLDRFLADCFEQSLDLAAFQCFVSGVNGRFDFGPGRFDPCVRRPFALSMQPDECFKEELVRQVTRCIALRTDRKRSREGCLQFRLVFGLDPLEHGRDILAFDGHPGLDNDRSVHRIAMGKGGVGDEQARSDKEGGADDFCSFFQDVVLSVLKIVEATFTVFRSSSRCTSAVHGV